MNIAVSGKAPAAASSGYVIFYETLPTGGWERKKFQVFSINNEDPSDKSWSTTLTPPTAGWPVGRHLILVTKHYPPTTINTDAPNDPLPDDATSYAADIYED